jgi:hypothetical protein
MSPDSRVRLAPEPRPLGIAGRLARTFVQSKLTPLVIGFALVMGAAAILVTPREEEPQIKVPMVDVFAAAPGRRAIEVERQLVAPLEKAFWSIPGVEYVYSTSSPDSGLVIIRFRVGEDPDRALVRVRAKLDALADQWPQDLPPPLVKPRSIDDVPVWALTVWSPTRDSATLRQIAAEVENEVKAIPEVSDTAVIGTSSGSSGWSSIRPGSRGAASRRPPSSRPLRPRIAAFRPDRSSPGTARTWWTRAGSSGPRRSSAPSSSPSRAGGPCASPTSPGSSTGPRTP